MNRIAGHDHWLAGRRCEEVVKEQRKAPRFLGRLPEGVRCQSVRPGTPCGRGEAGLEAKE